MSYHIVIPARYASTRLPGKPLLPIAGRPMIQHVYERAIASSATSIVVATDDERIRTACAGFGAEVCMTSARCQSGTDRIAAVVAHYGWSGNDLVVNLQGDEPFMPSAILDQVATGLACHPAADVATLATPLVDIEQVFDENVVKVVTDKAGFALYFSRAPIPWKRGVFGQEAPLPKAAHSGMFRHIGLYAYRAGFVTEYVGWPAAPVEQDESLEQLRVLWNGRRIYVALAAEAPPAGVDTADDLARANQI